MFHQSWIKRYTRFGEEGLRPCKTQHSKFYFHIAFPEALDKVILKEIGIGAYCETLKEIKVTGTAF